MINAKEVTNPRNAFAVLSVLMILGALYQEQMVELFFLAALASMAGFLLIPTKKNHTFWSFAFNVHIQTLVLPFIVLLAVIGVLSAVRTPFADIGAGLVRFSFTIWVCLQYIVLPPLALRPAIEKWIEDKRGQSIFKVFVVEEWIRISFDALWVAVVLALYLLTH